MPRNPQKNLARAIEHHERKEYIRKIDRAFNRIAADCSSNRVLAAVTHAPDWRCRTKQEEEVNGSICLPEVAKYYARHRNSGDVTAR